jgi:hypothetical protein
MRKKVLIFLLAVVFIFSSLYLIIFSSCGPNNLALAPIVGGGGTFNSQLPLFSVGTYKMNTLSSPVEPEVSFAYFNYTTKPFAFVNLNPIDNSPININIGSSLFPTQQKKVLVLGTAFAGGDSNSGSDRDIFWVGKILDPNNPSNWVEGVNVGGKNYIVIKGTNFIARFNYNPISNGFNSTFESPNGITVKKLDNTNNYSLADFQNSAQDFKSISFIRGNSNNGFYGVLVGRNCVFDCTNDVSNGNDFRNVYGVSTGNPPTGNDRVWEDVLPFDKNQKNFLLIGHSIDEGPNSAKFKYYSNSPSAGWGTDINGIFPYYTEPFYSVDYLTFLNNNSNFKAAYIAGKNALLGYVNTGSDQNQFNISKIEAIDLVNNNSGVNLNNVSFYGVTVLRVPGDSDSNFNVSGIAVGYDFASNYPIILKFTRTGNKPNPNPNPNPLINPNYNVTRVDISNLNLGSDVVFLDVNNVLISGINYVYVVGVDLSSCPIKPYLSGTLPPFTKSLVFPASAPFTTTNNDVINTLNNMRGILLYSKNGGSSFRLLGNPFISP